MNEVIPDYVQFFVEQLKSVELTHREGIYLIGCILTRCRSDHYFRAIGEGKDVTSKTKRGKLPALTTKRKTKIRKRK